MHSNWSILGIAPTADLIAIKRAYASQLKRNRPDDNPAGYQRLRQAYDWAQQHAHWQTPTAPHLVEETEEETFHSSATNTPSGLNAPDIPSVFEAEHTESSRNNTGAIDAHADEEAFSPHGLIDAVQAHYRQYGKDSLTSYWPELREALELAPFHMRDQININFVDLVLTENFPTEFIGELAEYFSWGRDFRLEKILGIDKALRLSEFLDGLIISPNRRKQFLVQYANLNTYHRLHQTGSWLKIWLFTLLNPLELFEQTTNHKPEYHTLGFDVGEHGAFRQKAKTAFILVFSLPFLLLGALHQKNALWSLPWPGNAFAYIFVAFFSIILLVIFPNLILQQVYSSLFRETRMEKWLIQNKPGKWLNGVAFAYFITLASLFAFFPSVSIQLADGTPLAWLLGAITVVFIVLLWPHDLPWAPVFPFLGLALGSSIAILIEHHDGAWTVFFLVAAWLTATQWLLFKTFSAISKIDRLPWRAFFPKSPGGWILYLVGFQGVLAIMGIVFFISAPYSILVYAIRYGWNKAYLALCAASIISISGAFPFNVFTFCLSLQLSVLAFILIERFSKRLTQSRFFQGAGNP